MLSFKFSCYFTHFMYIDDNKIGDETIKAATYNKELTSLDVKTISY